MTLRNWAPTDESTLLLWLDETNSNIANWQDKSGNGFDFTQSTAASQPTLINGVIEFLGNTDDYMVSATKLGLSGNPALTVVAVIKTDDGSGYSRFFQIGINAGSTISFVCRTDEIGCRYNNGKKLFQGMSNNSFHTVSFIRDENATYEDLAVRVDGITKSAKSVSNGTNTLTLTEDQTVVGHYAAGDRFDGALVALMVFNTDGGDIRSKAEGFAYHEYQRSPALPSWHPYESQAPQIDVVEPVLWTPEDGSAKVYLDPEDLTVGTGLSAWTDRISGSSFTQSDSALQPEVLSAAINGNKAVKFDGDGLESAGARLKSAMFVVTGLPASAGVGIFSGGGNSPSQHLILKTGGTFDVSVDGSSSANWGGASVNGGDLTIGGDIDIPSFSFDDTGTYLVYVTFGEAFSMADLGKRGSNYGDFTLGKFIGWAEQPEPVERHKAEAFLAADAGLTLPTGHPFGAVQPELEATGDYTKVTTTAELVSAVANAIPGETINIAEGTYKLTAPLVLLPFMSLVGSGDGTIITNDSAWAPGFSDVEQGGTESYAAYLIREAKFNSLYKGTTTLTDIKFTGEDLHGAFYAVSSRNLSIARCKFQDFGWSALRLRFAEESRIIDCQFIDAARERRIAGGSIYGHVWKGAHVKDCYFERTSAQSQEFYGIKSDDADDLLIEYCESKMKSFFIEVPHGFSNVRNEVRHCVFDGAISVPKGAGGGEVYAETGTYDTTDGSMTFDGELSWYIHHCYSRTSYMVEGARNSLWIDQVVVNDENNITGNVWSDFADALADGPVWITNSRITAVRGVFWANKGCENVHIWNNVIRSVADSTTDGFIGLATNANADYTTCSFKNNEVISSVVSKPLMRNSQSTSEVVVENNTMTGVSDAASYTNSQTSDPIGPVPSLQFAVGVNGQYLVDDWALTLAS